MLRGTRPVRQRFTPLDLSIHDLSMHTGEAAPPDYADAPARVTNDRAAIRQAVFAMAFALLQGVFAATVLAADPDSEPTEAETSSPTIETAANAANAANNEVAAQPATAPEHPVWDAVEHGFAENEGVKIHYAALGEGPLVLFVHGFPDFWYTWRDQMAGLQANYRVVAIDQRGYNRSDAPEAETAYGMNLLVADLSAVIKHLGYNSATVVGHDWGGVVAWNFAFAQPDMLDRLIILNLPHPRGTAQATAIEPGLLENTQYAQKFRSGSPEDPDIFFGLPMNPSTLAGWVRDAAAKSHYIQAFQRSSLKAMLNYYKRNYPPPPLPGAPLPETPPVNVPVLMFHGLEDEALPAAGLNNTWEWVNADLTIVTVPGAGHFVQQDASDLVTNTMRWWLTVHP